MRISRRLHGNIFSMLVIVWLVYLTMDKHLGKRFTYDDGVLMYRICRGELISPESLLESKPTYFKQYVFGRMNTEDLEPPSALELSINRRLEKLLFDEIKEREIKNESK